MALQTASRMYVMTSSGEKEIQLCVGDITALPVEEKVDVIMVSSFPASYSATSNSVIGALKHRLHVDVDKLSRDTAKEDLRQHFHCWISKKLPDELPYRQLVCFEKPRTAKGEQLDILVKDLFRAMMPVFNNENRSVITPLLATGAQNVQKAKMLEYMINAAIDWMRYGLPLQLLKIVIHDKQPDELIKSMLKVFENIKARVEVERLVLKDPPRRHDVFLIFAKDDADLADEVKGYLACSKQRLLKYLPPATIVTVSEVAKKKDSWQHDVVSAMMASSSVVPLLTKSFLEDPNCLDQYNLALCANRRTKRSLLSPICLDLLDDLPVYMTLVQWHNCKPRDKVKLQNACLALMEHLKETVEAPKVQYDVFVSYCHKNIEKAKIVVNTLKEKNSALQIFFDYEQLKTGESWQQSLYLAIDNSKCVIALLSNDYLDSVVCNEELYLATAKHLSSAKNQELILLPVEQTRHILLYNHVKPLKLQKELKEEVGHVADSITKWLSSGTKDAIFTTPEHKMDISELTEAWRRHDFQWNYEISQDGVYLAEEVTKDHKSKDHDKHAKKDEEQNEHHDRGHLIDHLVKEGKHQVDHRTGVDHHGNHLINEGIHQADHQTGINHAGDHTAKEGIHQLNHNQNHESQAEHGTNKHNKHNNKVKPKPLDDKPSCDVFISHTLQDRRYACFLAWSLARSSASLTICDLSTSESSDAALIESARCVVVVLSLKYHRNPKKVEEFNYILSRARKRKMVYVIVVDILPTKPWYMRLVFCNTCLMDEFWPDALASLTNASKLGAIFTDDISAIKVKLEKKQGPIQSREILALLKASCDVEDICLAVRNERLPSVHTQASIFFNIVELDQLANQHKSMMKREFTIVGLKTNHNNHDKQKQQPHENHNNHDKQKQPHDDQHGKNHANENGKHHGKTNHESQGNENSEKQNKSEPKNQKSSCCTLL